ncbi:hypothetical protein JCM17846_07710 [Iodidimonas nitroreducens]|uniref:Uncharacterized protein n=1 Tax=Iodidimonas nitroreducens TaxID=1236968 RepID=A0A5A7N7N4_9PROT|nr:hypothetical protein [Iodidimonas nitroreducens]GER03089.1 hypothetical protein JCM17846_07710 [Iodidimonas nitroreducens]
MVEWLAGIYGGTDAAWFFSIVTWILAIVAPLLLGVAFAVYADRKIWRQCSCAGVRMWWGRSAFSKALLMV